MHEICGLSHPRGVVKSPTMGWGLTTDFVPGVGNLTQQFVKAPVFPHTPLGVGVGHEIDSCISVLGQEFADYTSPFTK